jgi:hypothetical protein
MFQMARVTRRLGIGRQWLSRRSEDVLAGGRVVADESDRWFLGALRGLEQGADRAQGGADAVAAALASRWLRIRPRWLRPRTPRERIEALLRAEGKRQGFDVKRQEFDDFSRKMAILLELVYAGALPLDDISFESASEGLDELGDPPADAAPVEAAPGEVTSASADR